MPDREKALSYAAGFDYEDWKRFLIKNLGKGADAMIENEKKEGTYDKVRHAARIDSRLSRWDGILDIIDGLPSSKDVAAMLRKIGAPVTAAEIGITKEEEKNAFLMTKDTRNFCIILAGGRGRRLWPWTP